MTWDPSLEVEPKPVDPREMMRWDHSRLRGRMLEGKHDQDLMARQVEQYGALRAKVIGPPDLSVNSLRNHCRQLSVLYLDRGHIRHPDGPYPELLGEDVVPEEGGAPVRRPGFIEAAGFWSIMGRVQQWTLGLNEMLIQPVVVDVEAEVPRLVYRVVPPYAVTAKADYEDPTRPVCISELTKRKDPDTGKVGYCWDVWDIEDPEDPTYTIYASRPTGQGVYGDDVTKRFIDGPQSGDDYAWRRADGAPVLPWVVYHKHWPFGLWDAWDNREGIEGALSLSIDWAYWRHCFQDAAFPQRWAIGCRIRVDETIPSNGSSGARGHFIADPTRVAEFVVDDNATNVQIGQWTAGADVKMLGEALAAKEARLGQLMGVDASDLVRTSGDPRSGYALAISQESKRQAQIVYRPQFERADKELVALTAIVLNRALGTDFPEDGYEVEYAPVGAPSALTGGDSDPTALAPEPVPAATVEGPDPAPEPEAGATAAPEPEPGIAAPVDATASPGPATAPASGAKTGAVVFEGLNGAQLTGVLDVLERLTLGTVTPLAAVILISAAGIPADKAQALVTAMAGAKAPEAAPSSPPPFAKGAPPAVPE